MTIDEMTSRIVNDWRALSAAPGVLMNDEQLLALVRAVSWMDMGLI